MTSGSISNTQELTHWGAQIPVARSTRRMEFVRRRLTFLNHPCDSQNSEVAPRLLKVYRTLVCHCFFPALPEISNSPFGFI
jgi:hypothetical protein